MKYGAILFDVGGTLIHPKPTVGHIYAYGAQKFGIDISPDKAQHNFLEAWTKVKDNWQEPLCYGTTESEARNFWSQVINETFKGYLTDQDNRLLFDFLFDYFCQTEVWDTYNDVIPNLKSLQAKNINLGILSNWDVRLSPLLKGLNLLSYFHYNFISYQVGFEKPDLRFFQFALNRMKVDSEQVLYIGNDYEEDYLPATSIGIHCLLINRKDHKKIDPHVATISTLDDIQDILLE